MNVLYVTSYDRDGQQFNGYLLHKALKARGHVSHMAVMDRFFDEPDVHALGGPKLRRINLQLTEIEQSLSLYAVLPILSTALYRQPYYKTADIVHLELIHARQFFSLLNLPVMSRQHPLVWTMHDPWLLSGHCVHPLTCERWLTGCGHCPDLGVNFLVQSDTTAFTWKLKKAVMHYSSVSLIVASEWMLDRVKRSPILSHLPCHVIPFGVDTAVFSPGDKEQCRSSLGIPEDAFVIAFRSVPFSRNFKGTEYVEKALLSLNSRKPVYLLTFEGVGGLDSLRGKFPFVELDWVTDRSQLVRALSAADVFLMPSIAETFGMMAVESMACGTPVVTFEGTSLKGVIHAPSGGIAVPYRDHEALAGAVEKLIEDRSLLKTLSDNALRIVREEYTLDLYIKRHLDLYQSMLNGRRSGRMGSG